MIIILLPISNVESSVMFSVSRVSLKVNILNFRTKGLGSRRILLFMEHEDRARKVTSFEQCMFIH